MDTMNEKMRENLTKELPAALEEAIKIYRKFAEKLDEKINSADFKKHQEACKSAIAHIEALIKLAQNVDEMLPQDSTEHEDLTTAIKTAMEEVAKFREGQGE